MSPDPAPRLRVADEPYREVDSARAHAAEVAALREENTRLCARIAALEGVALYPYQDPVAPCRLCGQITPQGWSEWSGVRPARGPRKRFLPATGPRWWAPWRTPRPARVRCKCAQCGGVYYERMQEVVP